MNNFKHQATFFEGGRHLQMTESIELTIQSLLAYLPDHPDLAFAWSGEQICHGSRVILPANSRDR